MNNLSLQEKLWLSVNFDGLCPYCERTNRVFPKDLFYQLGVSYVKNGITTKEEGGWGFHCKCGKSVKISIKHSFNKFETEEK